jgi:hypothetical protein
VINVSFKILVMKYQRLSEFLTQSREDELVLSFDQVAVLVDGLPASAYRYNAWWANERVGTHSQAQSWLSVGRRTRRVDLLNQRVIFERDCATHRAA